MKTETNKLFKKNFTLVVIGQVISLFGNAILRFALPLHLLRETESSTVFGLVTALSFIPMIILSVVGGILADRVNKRNIMVLLDFTTAILITVFYIVLGKIPMIFLFTFTLMLLYGISGMYQPAVQASVPLLVNNDRLVSANAIINQVNTLANLLGPIAGGMLFGIGGLTPILLISILCFVLSAIMEIFIKIPFERQLKNKGIFAMVKDDLKRSYNFVKKEKPEFFHIAFIVSVFNLVLTAEMIVGVPVLIIKILKMNDHQLGLIQGVLAFGGLFGGILATVAEKKIKLVKAYRLLGICALCVAVMGLTLITNLSNVLIYIIITVMCFIAMASATLFTIQIFAMVQSKTPINLVGKIMATLITAALFSQPLGQIIYGILFDYFQKNSWIIFFGSSLSALCITIYSKRIFENIS